MGCVMVKAKKRVGRPITVNGTCRVHLRISEKTLRDLTRAARAADVTPSEYARRLFDKGLSV